MLFRKTDEAKKLVELQASDQKKLDGLRAKLEGLRGKWRVAQEEVERLTALNQAYTSTYRGFREDPTAYGKYPRTCELFYAERSGELDRLIEEACERRDSLTFELVKGIDALKKLTFQRLSLVGGCFGNFISAVADYRRDGGSKLQCTEELRQVLYDARKQAEAIGDMAALLDFIRGQVERIENESLQFCPLFKLDTIIAEALAVEIPASYPPPTVAVTEIGHFEEIKG